MADYRLNLIRQHCDTTGIRLNDQEKDLLCMILANPEVYDGFTSKLFSKKDSDRDYRDTWVSITEWQYRIHINPMLSIDKQSRHECDGYANESHWGWSNAWHITETRQILKILQEIESEL